MKKYWYCLLLVIIFACSKEHETNSPDNNYVDLQSYDLFALPDGYVADSFAHYLNTSEFYFDQEINRCQAQIMTVCNYDWIEYGNRYINENGKTLIFWKDTEDRTLYVDYYDSILSTGYDIIYDCSSSCELSTDLYNKFGIEFSQQQIDSVYCFAFSPVMSFAGFFSISIYQIFNNRKLNYSEFITSVDSETGRIYRAFFSPVLLNLDEIKMTAGDALIIENARKYFETNEFYSVPEKLVIEPKYYLVQNIICKKVKRGYIDEHGSYQDLFFDAQNGKFISTETHNVY